MVPGWGRSSAPSPSIRPWKGANRVKHSLLVLLLTLGATPIALAQPAPGQVVDAGQELTLPVPQCKSCAASETSQKRPTIIGHIAHVLTAPVHWACGGRAETTNIDVIAPHVDGSVSLAEAAAAKIRADEAGAKARRAAVHYLGTVDCHYYPEAEAALIAAVRADRNEGVRLEAVLALGNGCCRTKRTMDALNLVVSGSEQDGNPAETSERIRQAASGALQHYMTRGAEYTARSTAETLAPLTASSDSKTEPSHIQLAAYVTADDKHKRDACATDVAQASRLCTPAATPVAHTGLRGVLDGWVNIFSLRDTSAGSYRRSGLTPIGVVPGD